MCQNNRTLIICIGNSLVADDAVGCEVHRRLSKMTLPGVQLEMLGVAGLSLLEYLSGQDRLIVVDAVQLGGMAGTIHIMSLQQLPKNNKPAVSLHGIGLFEALSVGKVLYPNEIPKEVFLVGVEGKCFNAFSTELTTDVSAAIPRAIESVLKLIS